MSIDSRTFPVHTKPPLLTWPLVLTSLALFSALATLWASPSWPGMVTVVLVASLLAVSVIRSGRARLQHSESEKRETEHRLLVEAVQCTPVAMAVYTAQDKLLVCNQAYKAQFPRGFAYLDRHPEADICYADVLRHDADPATESAELEAHIVERIRLWHATDSTPVDRFYMAVGWRRVTKFKTPSGAIAGFSVDINALKQREAELQSEIERREALELRLTELANTDSLTKVANRRRFMEVTESELKRAKRYGHAVSLLVLDIDWFKSINDKFGHQTGDQALIAVAESIKSCIRLDVDQLGRLGGEEFGVLLPDTTPEAAMICAQRICVAIAALKLAATDAFHVQTTVSIGLSGFEGRDAPSLTTLYGQADQALYAAKHQGRNRVIEFEMGLGMTGDSAEAIETAPIRH